MKVNVKDVRELSIEQPCSIIDIVKMVNPEGLNNYCAAKMNGTLVDLRTTIDSDCDIELLDASHEESLPILRHTTAHIMAEAVKHLFPEAKLTIGPSTDKGFFYDFDFRPFNREDLDAIEKEMKSIIKKATRLERKVVTRDEARKIFEEKNEPYKLELLDAIAPDAMITIYSQDDFVDLCSGPHLLSTRLIKGFKLISNSATYWRGDRNGKSLTRIFGVAFFSKEDLEAHMEYLENIKNRDHNKLGRELELFTVVDVIGQGLPLLLPKGAKIVQTLQRWIEDLEDNEWGYTRTKTPLMAKKDLYEISGHWQHYRDGMFLIGDPEDEEVMALRPMTCPFQYFVYKSSPKSYRDLPKRYSETSTLFRNEDSGEMHGLTRVRQFTISEGHLIVRPDQMVEEFKKCLALAKYCLTTLGLQDDVTYHLSKWDPANTKKYIGTAAEWEDSQQHIRNILNELNIPFVEDDDEAAFYGPKVDINAKNVYGKEDTMITVQWDALLAPRYDMFYIDQNGNKVRPNVIHRTSIGCYERTLAWLIEKYEGALPTWLCPEQVRVLPISEKFLDYAEQVTASLKSNGIAATCDRRSEKIGYKLREARLQKIPYALIIGQKEQDEQIVSMWNRKDGDLGSTTLDKFVEDVCKEIRTRSVDLTIRK
ncbi:MAG: threonine--tRNA ligase [Bacteroidales bacterium]|nr:threonine--tRNA ligase [Bacteroidales bacterium]